MLRRLRYDVVVDAVFRIEPEVGLQQRCAGERGEHARGDLLLRDAELERLVPVDVDAKGRIVLRLGDTQVADAGNLPHFILQAQCDVVVGLQVVAVYLRVDRGGQSVSPNLGDDSCGPVQWSELWKLRREKTAEFFL